jgi:coatomer subunit beta
LYGAALILGGDFFTGAVLAAALTKLVLRFDDNAQDKVSANTLRAEVRYFFIPVLDVF